MEGMRHVDIRVKSIPGQKKQITMYVGGVRVHLAHFRVSEEASRDIVDEAREQSDVRRDQRGTW